MNFYYFGKMKNCPRTFHIVTIIYFCLFIQLFCEDIKVFIRFKIKKTHMEACVKKKLEEFYKEIGRFFEKR